MFFVTLLLQLASKIRPSLGIDLLLPNIEVGILVDQNVFRSLRISLPVLICDLSNGVNPI